MKTYTVEYYITDKQDKAIENLVTLAEKSGWHITKRAMFEMLMKSDPEKPLDVKIAFLHAKLRKTAIEF